MSQREIERYPISWVKRFIEKYAFLNLPKLKEIHSLINANDGSRSLDELVKTKGRTMLMYAARNGNTETINKCIVLAGVDVNDTNRFGQTPLMVAVGNGYYKTAKRLLDKGADVNVKDKLKDNGGRTALMYATHHGHFFDIVQLLLENGADVNFKDEDGWTVLEKAAEEGYTKIVQLLIEAGADV